MPALLLSIFRFVRLLLSGHQALAIENAALRLQLAAFQRKRKRPVLTAFDRMFWIALRPWLPLRRECLNHFVILSARHFLLCFYRTLGRNPAGGLENGRGIHAP